MSTTLPRTIGHYRLEEKLGAGGMGVVYRAIDTQLDRPVAIKMMHTRELLGDDVDIGEVQARFLREARAAARIKSRNVAHVLQLGTTDEGEAYIVMELLRGVALSRVMHKSHGPIAPARVVHIARQICKGMQSAHDLGVVHRDLKPANVMLVDEEGDPDTVKILDFGVAKLTDEGQQQDLTQAGALLGTLPFMAPEQISGGTIDARTDVYSLGIILYRMFTGLSVWDADSLGDIVRHQLSSTPPSMFERVTQAMFTPAIDAAVLKCLAKDPAARWQSMRELSTALDAAILQTAPTAHSFDATLNGTDRDLDVERATITLDLHDKGTAPTGNVRAVGPGARAVADSDDVGIFRDDTVISSVRGTGVDARADDRRDDLVFDEVDPAAMTRSVFEERGSAHRAIAHAADFGAATATLDDMSPAVVKAAAAALVPSALASASAARAIQSAPRQSMKKGPLAAGIVVFMLLLGIGVWRAITPDAVPIAPLPPVTLTTPTAVRPLAPTPPEPKVMPSVTPTTTPEPTATPLPAPTPVEPIKKTMPEPPKTKTPEPSITATPEPPKTKTPPKKPAASDDDGFVRVRTKDGP